MNDTLEIAIYVLAGVGVFFIVTKLLAMALRVWLLMKINSILGENGSVEKIIKEHLLILDVELDNDTYFCYNSEDKQFICQAKSFKEIKETVQKTSPEKVIVLSDKTPQDILERLKTEREEYQKESVV